MKFSGYTDDEDYHWRTLWACARDRERWSYGVNWRRWRFHYLYYWYDRPIWQLEIGPFWVAIGVV